VARTGGWQLVLFVDAVHPRPGAGIVSRTMEREGELERVASVQRGFQDPGQRRGGQRIGEYHHDERPDGSGEGGSRSGRRSRWDEKGPALVLCAHPRVTPLDRFWAGKIYP